MERIGEVLGRWLMGRTYIGVCSACYTRQSLTWGAVCLSCRGIVHRFRLS